MGTGRRDGGRHSDGVTGCSSAWGPVPARGVQAGAPVIKPVIPSPKELQYRNSAKLVIGGRFADPVIGIYRRDSHDIQDIAQCALHHPLINRTVAAVKQGIVKGRVPIYQQYSKEKPCPRAPDDTLQLLAAILQ